MIVSARPESCPVCRSSHAPAFVASDPPARWAPPVYDERSGILFWPTRKVATTSLTSWLVGGGWEPLDPRGTLPTADQISDTFTVVREPVSRYVSALWWVWSLGYCGRWSWEIVVDSVAEYMAIDGALYTCGLDEHFAGQWRTLVRAGDGARRFRLDDLSAIGRWLATRWTSDLGPIQHLLPGPASDQRRYALTYLDPEVIRAHYRADVIAWESLA